MERLKITFRTLLALTLATLVAGALGAAPSRATPRVAEAFIRSIYAPYMTEGAEPDWLGKTAGTVLAPPLLRLVRQDQDVPAGEIGALNADPFCNCQDYDRLTRLTVTVRATGRGRATAIASFVNGSTPETVTYRLVQQRGRWRIADIGSKDLPSLADFLREAIAERATSSLRPDP